MGMTTFTGRQNDKIWYIGDGFYTKLNVILFLSIVLNIIFFIILLLYVIIFTHKYYY